MFKNVVINRWQFQH
ncbi:Protein of unknown function [Lactobacillus acidophilus DSM 9126]|nr:Protein of unknown function [Lactobacillus acidophilus DSM 20079 = JCM 1132 = NBRC 13951 = CIP 76.13]CDF68524.1 Protein of unknown function [Lactobacillus acidophilus CIRM-BIA 442]CDF72285.1 Protein of unknown function [Lactobacillus acidophilus CIRM-BIA 445]CDF74103.1 Protein of unknown function [Lactobacillus acidophilus DSM 9126]CDF76111.1 Protein of unknown function [Lactobacillus acidophilus DSM 20242]